MPIKCPVCQQSIADEITPYNDVLWSDQRFFRELQIGHCPGCGFGFAFPELPTETISYFYEKIYRGKGSVFHIDFKNLPAAELSRNHSDQLAFAYSRHFVQLSLARAFCEFRAGDVLLDVGSSAGGPFSAANQIFPHPRFFGIELNEGAKEYCKDNYGAEIFKSIEEFIGSNNRAKIIIMSQSLEHYRISDLKQLFSNLAGALAKEGVLLIEVPHVDLRIHKEVRGADSPHLLFFSKTSLAKLLDNYGFEVLFIDTCADEYSETKTSRVKSSVRPFFNTLSPALKQGIRKILAMLRPRTPFSKQLAQHLYGGNRDCLRVVARLKGSK